MAVADVLSGHPCASMVARAFGKLLDQTFVALIQQTQNVGAHQFGESLYPREEVQIYKPQRRKFLLLRRSRWVLVRCANR